MADKKILPLAAAEYVKPYTAVMTPSDAEPQTEPQDAATGTAPEELSWFDKIANAAQYWQSRPAPAVSSSNAPVAPIAGTSGGNLAAAQQGEMSARQPSAAYYDKLMGLFSR